MSFCALKWLALIPLNVISTAAAWILAPVAVLSHDADYRLPQCLRWMSTPNSSLLGDYGHQMRWSGKSRYWQCVWWIWRNPACVLQQTEPLGFIVRPGDVYESSGDEATADNAGGHSGIVLRKIRRGGRIVAFQLYIVKQYGNSGKCFRLLWGWKIWKNPNPGKCCQHSLRVAIWKTFG